MIALLSPSKTQDFKRPGNTSKHSTPELIDDAKELVNRLRSLSVADLQSLMGVNEDLAKLNYERFRQWGVHQDLDDGLQAIFAYAGEVYRGFDVHRLSAEDLYYAQNHLRILSGLYGVIRPLDIIQPYRLEMGTKLSTDRGDSLYEFWGDRITQLVNRGLKNHQAHAVVNLASDEYFRAVDTDRLDGFVISPQFKEERDGEYKTIAVYAKNARGRMARYLITERIDDPEGLKAFDEDGYRYNPDRSTKLEWVFSR
jgi:hypothetical protein